MVLFLFLHVPPSTVARALPRRGGASAMDDRYGPSLFLLLPLSTSRHKLFHDDLLYLGLRRLWERVCDELLIGGDDYLVCMHSLHSGII